MNAEFFMKMLMGYRATKVLLVSSQLGVYSALADGPRTSSELAESLGSSEPHLKNLLRSLVGLGILERAGDTYQNSRLAAEHLVPGEPAYLGHVLAFHDHLWEGWSSLEEVVRTGQPALRLPKLLEDRHFRDEYIRGVHAFSGQMADEVARLLAALAPRRLLDVGGGAGTYSLALLEALPDARAVLLDLPETLEVTRAILEDSPHRARIELEAKDYLAEPYGEDVDLVLMSHVTHDEGPDGLLTMFRSAYAALNVGGHLAIHDWVIDEDSGSPLSAALFSVNLMVYTAGGRIYTGSEYSSLLVEAGFERLETFSVLPDSLPNPTSLLVAKKPG